MNKLKFSFAAIIAIIAVSLTLATNARSIADIPNCYSEVEVDGVTYENGVSTTFPLVDELADPLVAPTTVTCNGSGKFCCVTLRADNTIIAVFQKS